jgi:hypothetical protein
MNRVSTPSPQSHGLGRLAGALALAIAWPAMAHEGHGADTVHWHATDALGFILATAVGLGLLAWWRGRR